MFKLSRPRKQELSRREKQIVALVAEGLSHKGVAEKLGITPSSARTMYSRACAKLRAKGDIGDKNLNSHMEIFLWGRQTYPETFLPDCGACASKKFADQYRQPLEDLLRQSEVK